MKNNLWILTEERPKKEVIRKILEKFSKDYSAPAFIDPIKIFPILEKSKFTFTYEVSGFRCNKVEKVYIKTISGFSSCVDFLIFLQENEPSFNDKPIYAIEETKTDDKESRNTGIYQRCSKFVFINNYYPNIKKIMLYNLQIEQRLNPSDTYIFGTRLLLTLGVEILGKELDQEVFKPFSTIEEIIISKRKMRAAPKGNVPISINKIVDSNTIEISGRLEKNGSLAHDPNIGALTVISATLRNLNWEGKIIITKHGLKQSNIGKNNKFLQIANLLNIELSDLAFPKTELRKNYWYYDKNGEKLGTIFIHLVVENFTIGESIFENHAGCEKGYFLPKDGDPIPLKKYSDRDQYKAGDKSKALSIPDLILIDFGRSEIINIEGKKYEFRKKGIEELKNYEVIESLYIKKYYPKFKIIRTVVLYGGNTTKIVEIEVGFILNQNGALILSVKAPKLFKEAIKNLIDFWAQ
jgi:hypothetical protein